VIFIKGRNKNITKINPLELKKAILKEMGEVDRMYISGYENMKIYCKNEAQKTKALSTVQLNGIDVITTEPISHYTMSTKRNKTETTRYTKGVIMGVSDEITPDEICEEETHAIKANRMTKIKEGRSQKTAAVLLFFDMDKLPEHVTLGYTRYSVRQYNAVPIRCHRCQTYGHVLAQCRTTHPTCSACAGHHEYKDCSKANDVKTCANCKGRHSAAYKGCKSYKTATTIVQMASIQRLSYAAAAKMHTVQQTKLKNVATLTIPSNPAAETLGQPDTQQTVQENPRPVPAEDNPAVEPSCTILRSAPVAKSRTVETVVVRNTTLLATSNAVMPQRNTRKKKTKRTASDKSLEGTPAREDSSDSDLGHEGPTWRDFLKNPSAKRRKTNETNENITPTNNEQNISMDTLCTFIARLLGMIKNNHMQDPLKQAIIKTAVETLGIKSDDITSRMDLLRQPKNADLDAAHNYDTC